MVSDCDLEVKAAHPLKVKAVAEAKIKTDKISADILTHLLRANFVFCIKYIGVIKGYGQKVIFYL